MQRSHYSSPILVITAALAFAACFQPESETCPSGRVCPIGTQCAAAQDVCIETDCGNGVVDTAADEVCDDGNVMDGDGCSADCKSDETCGNGIKDVTGEVCDDHNNRDGDGCSADCRSAEGCGNSILDPGEECDDGNALDDDNCVACRIAICGDGFTDNVDPRREQCDTVGESATCNFNCTLVRCGDRIVNASAGEQCDTGTVDTVACNANCTVAFCGDNHNNAARGEQCDTGGNSRTCDADCTPAGCGDGFLNSAANEQCDTHGNSAICDADCTPAACGDSFLNPAAHEQCDDGNATDTDDCVSNCRLNVCGDGFRDLQGPITEACDDGNTTTETACAYGSRTCTACDAACATVLHLTGPFCGDGMINGSETCDDGNTATETSCPYGTPSCIRCNGSCSATLDLTGPFCGDGTPNGSEVCDDGNNVTEQACDYGVRTCRPCDAACATVLNLTGPYCGDGLLNGPENCDDGNTTTETSCPYGTPTCTLCNSSCSTPLDLTGPYCGDGTRNGPEVCDDGNTDACGTCSATCTENQNGTATGRITAIRSNRLTDGASFTLDDGIHSQVIFEFDTEGDGVSPDHIRVDVSSISSSEDVATQIRAAINGVTTTLEISAASGTNNVVNMRNDRAGSLGNQAITETVEDGDFQVSGMSGGGGQDCPAGTGCASDNDCTAPLTCVTRTCQ